MINFLINNKLINKIIDNFKRDYKFSYINYNEKINNIFFNFSRLKIFNFNTVKTAKKFILDAIGQKEEVKEKINEYKNYIEVNE